MLAFVTSLRARALAQDWAYHSWLLERCLSSITNQESPEWRAFVVCHDLPDFAPWADPRIHWLTVDIPLPKRTFADMVADKVIKTSIGMEAALQHGARFVMPIDADDLVSRRICGHVLDHEKSAGWFIERGSSHRYGSGLLLSIHRFHLLCGTSNIIGRDHIRFAPDPMFRNARTASVVAMGHGVVAESFAQSGTPLQSLGFAGAVYIQHQENTSNVDRHKALPQSQQLFHRLKILKRLLPQLPHVRRLTAARRAEFSIPAHEEVPAPWRAPWWRL